MPIGGPEASRVTLVLGGIGSEEPDSAIASILLQICWAVNRFEQATFLIADLMGAHNDLCSGLVIPVFSGCFYYHQNNFGKNSIWRRKLGYPILLSSEGATFVKGSY